MQTLLFWVLLVVGHGARHDDMSTSTPEGQWFRACENMDELSSFCERWNGPCHMKCVDLFSASKRVARTFQRYGHSACSFDIMNDKNEDILSPCGFYRALVLALSFLDRLLNMFSLSEASPMILLEKVSKKSALFMRTRLVSSGLLLAAPPCSLWVPISQSVHRRYVSRDLLDNTFF